MTRDFTWIPFLDLKRQDGPICNEIQAAIEDVVGSCVFACGPAVETFEEEFASYCGVRYCIGVNSGTSALHLALIACGIGPGDEVITVPMTFVATAWAISYVGAQPVFVDIEPVTCTMDVKQVEKVITPHTKAIVPVHLYGQLADMSALGEICERHNLSLVEDAAQAHGAVHDGRRAGSFGRVGCFSFYPGKNLGAYGEGGAVTTNDESIANRVRALRDHAQSKKYQHEELGFNYRMDNIQGAVLRVKLRKLDSWNFARSQVATRYHEMLAETPLTLPRTAPGRRHAWHLYVVRHRQRDRLKAKLTQASVGTGLHYPIPVHLQGAYVNLGYRKGDFPISEQVARECLSLPIYTGIREEEQGQVAAIIKSALPG